MLSSPKPSLQNGAETFRTLRTGSPGMFGKEISRWFWDLDHHGEIASRKKIPTLRTGLKGGPRPSSRPFFREGFQIQFSPFGKFRTGRAIFFRPTPKFFADRFTEVGCGGEVVRGGPFGEDGCQERCRAADTTRTPRASTYFGSTTL